MTTQTAELPVSCLDTNEEPRDMTSNQGRSPSDEKHGANLQRILEELGSRGRYQIIQLVLTIYTSFLYSISIMDYVFVGYQPDYQCSQVENVTQLEAYLPDDVINFTFHDVQYHQCSIDVIVNTSNASFTHSLPCVAGVNFSMPSHTSFLTEWSLVCEKTGLSQLSQTGNFGGQVLGYLMSSVLADRYGRKKVYVTCALCTMVTAITTALVPSYYMFLAGKITLGFLVVGAVHSAYTMFMELLPQEWRCMASVMDSIMWFCGCIFMAIVAYCLQGVSWRYLSLAFSSVFAFTLLLPWLLDESLRWLLATGQIDEAEKILKKACRMNGKDFGKIKAILHKQIFVNSSLDDENEICSINANEEKITNITEVTDEKAIEKVTITETLYEGTVTAENVVGGVCTEESAAGSNRKGLVLDNGAGDDLSKGSVNDPLKPQNELFSARYTVLDLFRYRVVFVPLLVCASVWITANLYYYAVMLGSANLSGNRFLNFGLLNLQDIPSILVALFLQRRLNRRPLAFTYGMLAGSFLIISVTLVALGGGEGVTLTLATVAQYAGMFALTGSYIMLFVYSMEVYPTAMRAVGSGAVGMLSKITDMAAPFLLLWAEETPWAPGVLLGCLCCLASLSIWLLPETRHRKLPDTIEEIQAWKKNQLAVSGPTDAELTVHSAH